MDSCDRSRWAGLVIVVLIAVLGPGFGWGMMGGGVMGPWMMGGWGGDWGAANPLWGIASLIFWLLIVGGIVLLVVWGFRQAGSAGPVGRRPLDILKERYARGELTHEQYAQMRRDLE